MGGDGVTIPCRRCEKTWERDPVLEVECPTCEQPPGSPCVSEAPSGHRKSQAFQGLPPWGHDERDLAALEAGAYGECPEGRCPSPEEVDRVRARWERRKAGRGQDDDELQRELFVGAA